MINLGNIEIADLRLGASQVSAWFGGVQVWGGGSPTPPTPTGDWLCFTATQANSTLHLDKFGSPNAISLETSTDGSTWTDYSWTDSTGDTLALANVGDKVYMRAKTENQTIGSSSSNYYKFVMSGQIAASGNIQTLLKADGSRSDAPVYCYENMFSGCSSLTTAPSLPATTLNSSCYNSMFYGCTSLTVPPPELPALEVPLSGYLTMFQNTALTSAPMISATSIGGNMSMRGMFYGCSNLTAAPEIHVSASNYQDTFSYMFTNCTGMLSAKLDLQSGNATRLMTSMYQGCSSLTAIECPQLTAWPSQTTNWVNGVAAAGTFTCPTALGTNETITRGTSNCPAGWTVVNTDAA